MRVLVVDDDVVSRTVLSDELARQSHDVTVAANGNEALNLFNLGPFDIIIVDWLMPEMDGIELCRAIRAHPDGQSTYLLMATSKSRPEDFSLALEAGADDYVAKPFDPNTLALRILVAARHATTRVARHESLKRLDSRLAVEAAIARISQNLAVRQVGGVLPSLALLGETLGACRVCAFRFDEARTTVDNTHEWVRKGVESLQPIRRNLATKPMIWWISRVQSGKRIVFNSLADVPAELPKLREKFETQKVTARADVPIYTSTGVLLGYLAIEMSIGPRTWRNEELLALDIVSRMIGAYWERREAYDALSLRDRVIQRASDGIIILDALSSDRPIIYANDGFCRITGYDREDVIGRNPSFVEGPNTDPESSALITESLLKQVPFTVEIINHRKDGSPMWNRVSCTPIQGDQGRVTHFVGVLSDITEQRHVESTLLESERRFRAFAESAPDAMIMVDQDGAVVGWNPAASAMFSIDDLEIIGTHFSSLVPHPARRLAIRAVRGAFAAATVSGTAQRKFEAQGLRGNGAPFPIEVSMAAWMTARGPYAAAIVRDVSKRKQLEAQLRQSQKMEALGTLAGGIAHDFNNILGPIFAHTELAMAELESMPKTRERLSKVLRSATRAKALVERILAFSRKSPTGNREVELASCVSDSIAILAATIPRNITFTSDVGALGVKVNADQALVHQVVLNLVTNASQAIGNRNGNVRITVRERSIGAELSQAVRVAPGDYVVVEVTDDGPGIPEGVISRIFEPFYTTKSDGSGTGLGLSAVHGALTQSGGAVTVDSEPGRGARFRCWWKKIGVTTQPGAEEGPHPKSRRSAKMQGRILVVDDEVELAEAVSESLKSLGFRTVVCDSGQAALSVIKKDPEEYVAVISDRMMPGMDGLELATKVREIHPKLPFLLATGFEAEGTQEKCREAGITALLHKPVSLELLRRVLESSLNIEA